MLLIIGGFSKDEKGVISALKGLTVQFGGGRNRTRQSSNAVITMMDVSLGACVCKSTFGH